MNVNQRVYAHLVGELDNDSVVVDIGAYTGKVARDLISKSGGDPAKYYLIEGCPENYEKLLANCDDCRLFKQVISSSDGEVEFFVGHHPAIEGSSQSNSLIRDFIETKDWNKKTNAFKVRSSTLDSFYRDNGLTHVRLLKINCEGGEYKILGEPDSTFAFAAVTDFIYLQLHGKSKMFTSEEYTQKKRDIIEKLKGLGFEPVISDNLADFGKGHIHILFRSKRNGQG